MIIRNRFLFLVVGVSSMFGLDQLTKWLVIRTMTINQSIPVVGEWVRLTFVYNRNGAFGLRPHALFPFMSGTLFFALFSVTAIGLILYLYFKSTPSESKIRLALMLILGGALGNFADRIRMGQVTDFIDCDFPNAIMERWPVFNVADSCITVGVFLLLILSFIKKKDETGN